MTIDNDECLNNNGGCHVDATCKNIKGGFNCTCKTGNGTFCQGLIFFFFSSFFFFFFLIYLFKNNNQPFEYQ